MLDRVILVCHGETAAPHRGEFVFDRDQNGRWQSLHRENFQDHEWNPTTRVQELIESGVPVERLEGHHFVTAVDGHRHYRVRGGVRRTKRGYELECWKQHSTPQRGVYALPLSILQPALDSLAQQNESEFDVARLVRESQRRVRR